jgi:hypothetical protein
LSLCFFGISVGRNLLPLGYAFIALPAALGIVSIGLSFRPRVRYERAFVATSIAVLTITSVALLSYKAITDRRSEMGRRQILALLSGDDREKLERIEICHQQRRVICVDPQALRYLERQFIGSDVSFGIGGCYKTSFRFRNGAVVSLDTVWGSERGSISVNDSDDLENEDPPPHGFAFKPPVPANVREMLSFLAEPYEKVAGQILTIASEGTKTEYDPSLDMR